jgi:hypothetical protein
MRRGADDNLSMFVVDLARLQLASSVICHFLFVPPTIGPGLITGRCRRRGTAPMSRTACGDGGDDAERHGRTARTCISHAA